MPGYHPGGRLFPESARRRRPGRAVWRPREALGRARGGRCREGRAGAARGGPGAGAQGGPFPPGSRTGGRQSGGRRLGASGVVLRSPRSPQVNLCASPRGARGAPGGPRVSAGRGPGDGAGRLWAASALGSVGPGRLPGAAWAWAGGARRSGSGATAAAPSRKTFSLFLNFVPRAGRALAGRASRLGPPPPLRGDLGVSLAFRRWGVLRVAIVPWICAGRAPPPFLPLAESWAFAGARGRGSWHSSPTHGV